MPKNAMIKQGPQEPKTVQPGRVAALTDEEVDAFASDDWRPSAGEMSAVAMALWRGGRGFAYIVQNADVLSPEALTYFQNSGEYIRQRWSHAYVPLADEVEAWRDLIAELEKALDFLRSRSGG